MLFTCMLNHGYALENILSSTITPILKHYEKSVHDSNNNRGIALSDILGKMLIIQTSHKHVLYNKDLQF